MRISDWSSDVCSSDLEHLWTIAAARLILGAEMTIQAPPNLHRREDLEALLHAGVNDWGGVSPVTPDHVNPEAPWPHLEMLADATHVAGRMLSQRLAIGPSHARDVETWVDARSEEHTSELQSLMRISYAVFCLKKKNK